MNASAEAGERIVLTAAELESRRLREDWINFLGRRPFNWFVHLTFRHPVTPAYATKALHRWANFASRGMYGPRWQKHADAGIVWAAVVEGGATKLTHLHVLLRAPQWDVHPETVEWMREWWRKKEGIAEFGPVRSLRDSAAYLTKTVPQGGEILLSKNFR